MSKGDNNQSDLGEMKTYSTRLHEHYIEKIKLLSKAYSHQGEVIERAMDLLLEKESDKVEMLEKINA